MALLPDTDIKQIEFCETHLPTWEADPAAVGLTLSQVQALALRTKAAREAYNAAEQIREASKAATLTLRTETAGMRESVATMLRTIKAFAAANPQPGDIYAAARLDAPLPPSPTPAPGRPDRISASLEPGGGITLRWQADRAAPTSGVFFRITRAIGGAIGGANGSTDFICIGCAATGARGFGTFTDETLPPGATSAKYMIQGFKAGRGSEIAGPASAAFAVQFGPTTAAIATTVPVSRSRSAKLAA